MANLLSQEAKKAGSREYLIRIVSVWVMLAAGVLFSFSLFLLPTYILVRAEQVSVARDDESADTRESELYAESVANIERANALGKLLLRKTEGKPSEALDKILSEAGNDIALSGVIYQPKEEAIVLEVRGIARTREALAEFIARLKRNPYFANASVPVADLAKDERAPFTATITLRANAAQ